MGGPRTSRWIMDMDSGDYLAILGLVEIIPFSKRFENESEFEAITDS